MWINNSINDLIAGVLRHGPEVLEYSQTTDDISQYTNRSVAEYLNYPCPTKIDPSNWLIPEPYKDNVIEYWLLLQCKTQEQRDRVTLELELYKQHNMIPVLNAMKYVVDTLRQNNVVWGVGRGSSVASYVLYLIGVHKIDSIKYNLPIEEFFKGEQNG